MSLLFLSLLCVLQKVTSSEWVQTQGRSGDTSTSVFSFTVQFKRASDTALDVAVEEIVNPSSPKFRHFLSSDDIAQLVAPIRSDATEKLQEHLQSVRDCSNVIVDMYSHGDFARVTTTEACVESWLKQQLFEYARGKFRIVRFASPVTIPREISAFVQHIHGVADKLPQAHTKPGSSAGKFPGDAVSPPKIRQVYGISVQGANKTSQAVAAFEDAEFKQSDCDEFLSNYSLPATKWGVIGPNNGGYFGEAGLDTQYLPATGSGIQSYFVSREQFDMLAWSLEVLNMSAPPHVLSVSWGAGESGYDASHIQAASSEVHTHTYACVCICVCTHVSAFSLHDITIFIDRKKDHYTMTGCSCFENSNKQDIWKKFIEDTFPKLDERMNWLQIMCNSLSGRVLEKFLVQNGGGSNGKSLLNDIFRYLQMTLNHNGLNLLPLYS